MKTGVLFIHGFTGGPYEVQPLITFVKAHTDWSVEVPTLPGHGVTLNLSNVSAESMDDGSGTSDEAPAEKSGPGDYRWLFHGRIDCTLSFASLSGVQARIVERCGEVY